MQMSIEILVVEDEPLVRMDIADQLRDHGYSVHEAGNADDAILILEMHGSISLIITDIDMPGSMDGLKLAAAVRDRWPPVKIIVVSGIILSRSRTFRTEACFFQNLTCLPNLSNPCKNFSVNSSVEKR